MHLKSLTLRGFKSFATATTLRFEPGINCVVGPNGSGKSNVVDALAWVMGEQGAKSLRGGNMADVIFAGTAKRPALGRAEVSLTIDNSDGALPIEYSEVTISRTLFRSGGSEYAINGTACRLLDIQELLSDTGMGREMHVIIGQGKLDEVLTASAEDRRGFIEEAAGVLKHRRRKEKALRKLESMQGNLTRLDDLTKELRRQLGPLARQAATARRAQVIQADVFDARARLMADDLAQVQARVAAGHVDEQKLAAQRQEIMERVAHARESVALLQTRADAAHPHIAAMTENWQRLSSLVERFRGLAQLAQERERTFAQPLQSVYSGESPDSIRARAEELREKERQCAQAVDETREQLRQAISAREDAERVENEIDEQLMAINRSLADRREAVARLTGKIATASSRIEALSQERERVARATAEARTRAEQARAQVRELEEQAVAHTDGDDTLSIAHEEAARERQAAHDNVDVAQRAMMDAQSSLAEWSAKAETLEMSLAAPDATAWLIDEHRVGVRGLVRDVVHVTAGWEGAVEAVLAGVASGAVVTDVDAAIDALRAARDQHSGRLDMLIMTPRVHDAVDDQARAALAACDYETDVAQLASAAIVGDDEMAQALRCAVAGVVLCADLAVARQLLEAGAPAVATPAADVIYGNHAWGGHVQASAILARQAAYEQAKQQAQMAAEELANAQEVLSRARVELARTEEQFDTLAGQLTARDSQMAALTAQLGVLRQTVSAAQDDVVRNEERLERIDVDKAELCVDVAALQEQHETLSADPEEFAAKAKELSFAREKAHHQAGITRTAETDQRLKLRSCEEEVRLHAGQAQALEARARSVEDRIARESRDVQRRQVLAQQAREVHADAQLAEQAAQQALDTVNAQRIAAEKERVAFEAELAEARQNLDRLVAQERDFDALGHRHELALAEHKLRYSQLAQRAVDDLGISADSLIAEYGPHTPIVDPADEQAEPRPFVRAEQEKRLAKAERELTRLGKINPLALEEHAALEERQKYLSHQLEDLRRSREDLLNIVKDIDRRVNEVMSVALADVAREFERTFERLFPGGQGKLVLTDPESVLTTGIEIEARPPGKRVKRLSLLSGGERSLTAVAFLVAIFTARPSPFYVMDEVEAALDDTNLTRLLDVFAQLRDHSQLLVITHQKRTMEIADTLYGISMREDGVTSVISQRVKDCAGYDS
ncbi:chromosome segregation protein SMC [Trueperella sp. LYQ143]|uniref:chromosome segregation protein SMC n=1 Tax=Trueperella sp. LYQ143 TaxID=3391059 RepID=UPI003983C03F